MKNNEVDIILGKMLKEYRNNLGYSMQYVATQLGFKNRSSIKDYESGRYSMDIVLLKKFCNLYKLDYKDILDEIYYKVNL